MGAGVVVAERGCMQTAVRGGLLTPFIHPFLVKPGDARGIGGSFQGFDGSSRQKGWRSRDARGTATASVVPVRQCDPELAASRSIPGSLSYPPASHPPPSPPPPASHPSSLSLSLCARASSSRYLVSSDPKERGGGSTIKPQDAFREDPVTRALALSSALTKSATEREETRPLRESAPRRRVAAWYYPRIDTLISCHPVSVLVPDGLLNIFLPLSRAHLRWFSPQFHGNEIHVLRLRFFPRRKFFSIPQPRGGLFFSLPLSLRPYIVGIYTANT